MRTSGLAGAGPRAVGLALSLFAAACGGNGGGAVSGERAVFRTCSGRTFSPLPAQGWRHTSTSILTTPAGAPAHSAQDVIAAPGAGAALVGKFAYGIVSRDLQDEDVHVVLDACDGWRDLGNHATDSDGRLTVGVPFSLGPGMYEARFQVLGDQSTAVSFLWILPAGSRLVIGDIDGTMTESDSQLFMQLLDGSHVPLPYPGAVDLTRAHAERGWIFVYLTGRPYVLTEHSRRWLADLGFAPGPLHVTDSNDQALPIESGVGDFKKEWIQGLLRAGHRIDFAYGNAGTDIYAYLGAGLPASSVSIIGDNAGMMGTNSATGTWAPRAAEVRALPLAEQPFR
jgi:hypothetical protein